MTTSTETSWKLLFTSGILLAILAIITSLIRRGSTTPDIVPEKIPEITGGVLPKTVAELDASDEAELADTKNILDKLREDNYVIFVFSDGTSRGVEKEDLLNVKICECTVSRLFKKHLNLLRCESDNDYIEYKESIKINNLYNKGYRYEVKIPGVVNIHVYRPEKAHEILNQWVSYLYEIQN